MSLTSSHFFSDRKVKAVVTTSPSIVGQRKSSTLVSSTTTTPSSTSAIFKPKRSINDNFCKDCIPILVHQLVQLQVSLSKQSNHSITLSQSPTFIKNRSIYPQVLPQR